MKKKNALVTGATGGIGREFCKMLVNNGYFLYINARNLEAVAELMLEIKKLGGDCESIIFDIRDIESATKKIDSITQIDVLINNAGILRDNLIYNIPLDDWMDVINTNFYSVDSLYRALEYKLSDNAVIINMCSISGVIPRSGQLAYAASKRMLIQWTQNMASIENQKKYFAISPGPVDTRLIQKTAWYNDTNALDRIPLGRYAKPEEIAEFIEHIIKDVFLFQSGSNLILDGGFTQTMKNKL